MKEKAVAVCCLSLVVLILLGTDQAQSAKANYSVYQVGGDIKAPRPITTAIPPTPEELDRDFKVRLSFVVTPEGSVEHVKLLKRSKSDFDNFAIDVVSKWKFEPATKGGNPVAVRLEAEVRSHK